MNVDVLNMLENAINSEQLKFFLEGVKDYEIPNQLNSNTDKDIVLFGGIYKYYRKNPSSKIDKLYENTLISMLDGTLFDLLNVYDYAYMQILAETKGIAPFKLSQDFYRLLREKIKNSANLLAEYKQFSQYGSSLPKGAYSYIQNLNDICETKYGRAIL